MYFCYDSLQADAYLSKLHNPMRLLRYSDFCRKVDTPVLAFMSF